MKRTGKQMRQQNWFAVRTERRDAVAKIEKKKKHHWKVQKKQHPNGKNQKMFGNSIV